MASAARSLAHNVPGEFYVDSTCIDCDTCRWMAPDTFTSREDQSSVHRQPATREARLAAEQALIACPTGSIGTRTKHDLSDARASFPIEVAPGTGVFHLGYHAEARGTGFRVTLRPPRLNYSTSK